MTDVLDVGQYIYNKLGWIDSWRLQKLTYYVEAWGLAWEGQSVFANDFEAWADGPVSRKLFRENKYGAGPMACTLPGADVDAIPPRVRAVIDSVLDFYGSKTKAELVHQTHVEQPWLEARGDLPPEAASSRPLSETTMRKYYTRVSVLGIDGPKPPSAATDPCVSREEAQQIAVAEAGRWNKTLEWLSER